MFYLKTRNINSEIVFRQHTYEQNLIHIPWSAFLIFRSVLIGRLERAFVTVDITIMNVNIFQNDVIFREAQFLLEIKITILSLYCLLISHIIIRDICIYMITYFVLEYIATKCIPYKMIVLGIKLWNVYNSVQHWPSGYAKILILLTLGLCITIGIIKSGKMTLTTGQ